MVGQTTTKIPSIMRTARYTGILAVAVCLHGAAAWAGEGADLRGLRAPSSAFEGHTLAHSLTGTGLGLKRGAPGVSPELGSALVFSGATLSDRRLTTADADYRFTLYQPVGQNIPALAEANIHTLNDTLPRYTLSSQVTRALPGGWGLGFGVRQTEYNFSTASLFSISAERSWGSFRGAYTLYANRAEGMGFGSAHRLEVSYLYGERNVYGERNIVGLSYTTGRDIETLGLPAALSLNDVRDWTLSGRHWLSPNWALTYDVSQEQGSLYRRPGLRLGVSRSF
jgi:YaiO family outer membrane protein